MTEDSFFEALQHHYHKQLPFVVYSRPITHKIKCWLQNDATLHKTDTFTESGFVFAPFNLEDQTILFPKDACQFSEIDVDAFDVSVSAVSEVHENTERQEAHTRLVSNGIQYIQEGRLRKVVLSRYETKKLQNKNPFAIFKRLISTYKNAMVYCWYHPKVGLWIGATPELLLKLEANRLTTISLAGTQPYRRISKPIWTNKEYEEQEIVTDYIVEQIEPFTKQVSVSPVDTIRAGNLIHLKTKISSIVKDSLPLKEIVEALHPTPAVCGFPKADAKAFILQNENYKRNFYTGFLGELNLKQTKTRNYNRRNVENNAYGVVKNSSTFYVNLRCMQLVDDEAYIYVGGGITKDSDPYKEWEETVNKAKTIEAVLD
ncbi:chorismate-binding protein [Winogradskyella eckloniae]|uniref:chorismate-binding protein n=1 Tax=Winogradskyella eckloniae TaxID=1089306 RepID=UPI0015664B2E|nr:chorismate-binding protein [Winogradskyella eckloniae]NRD19954.1 chorismate-binding protein [Winogradskyella eckloniae]